MGFIQRTHNLARRTQIAYDGVAFGSPQEPITQVLTYNDRNELTGSERDNSTALTRTYAYDPIGNRTGATQNEAPDADTIAYVRNALNQYKQVAATGQGGTLKQGLSYDEDGNLVERFIAGDMDCDGDVDMDDIDPFVVALLDGQAAYETAYPDCEYLRADVNGDGVVDFDDLDVFLGLVSSGNAALWVAYTWDAENRLVGVEPGGTPKSGDLKVGFVYDYMGRRVEKKVWTWDPQAGQGGAWVLTGHRKFVWNGWLLLMELDGLNDDAVLRKWCDGVYGDLCCSCTRYGSGNVKMQGVTLRCGGSGATECRAYGVQAECIYRALTSGQCPDESCVDALVFELYTVLYAGCKVGCRRMPSQRFLDLLTESMRTVLRRQCGPIDPTINDWRIP